MGVKDKKRCHKGIYHPQVDELVEVKEVQFQEETHHIIVQIRNVGNRTILVGCRRILGKQGPGFGKNPADSKVIYLIGWDKGRNMDGEKKDTDEKVSIKEQSNAKE
ncbi:MAG TPA: hypothetical protein PL061_11700 [Syntrophales bacterium]|nr:hypothetical protein [Syntrophales bacterium]